MNLWSGIPNDICTEQETGDVLSDSVYKRNLAVENALNVKISNVSTYDDDMARMIEQSVMSGSGDVDAVFPRMYLIPQLVDKGLLHDMVGIDAMDFTQPYYDQNSVSALLMHGKLYAAASDITYFDKLSTYVTFFNQKVVADYDLGDMYSLAMNGQWTLDKALELGSVMTADLNSDGRYDENDSYGISCQNDGVYIFLHGGNLKICDTDENGDIAFSLTSRKCVDALQKIYSVKTDSSRFFNRQNFGVDLNGAINMFNDGRTLFLIRPLQSLFVMRSMQSDFGILPIPKLNADDASYGSAINPYSATMLYMPLYLEDAERSGEVIQYMAYESSQTVNAPLYETVLGNKLVRDDASSEMLDIVFDSRVYDPGLIWNFGDITTTLILYESTDVSSMLESVKSVVNDAIGKLNEVTSE